MAAVPAVKPEKAPVVEILGEHEEAKVVQVPKKKAASRPTRQVAQPTKRTEKANVKKA